MFQLDNTSLFAISALALILFGLLGKRSNALGILLIVVATGAGIQALRQESGKKPELPELREFRGGVEEVRPMETNFVAAIGESRKLAPPRLPREEAHGPFVGSSACRECHDRQYESWHDSYHRTMTQVVTPATVMGDFSPRRLTNNQSGKIVELGRAGELFTYAEVDRESGQVSTPRALGLSTGSHHMQAYWYSVALGDSLGMMPFVYLRDDRRWIPREAAFVGPPGADFGHELGRWNEICFNCHSTGGESHRIAGSSLYDTRVAEFGISCESCHGAGSAHVAFRREPTEKTSGRADPILNPASVDAPSSIETCGKCHRALTFKDGTDGVSSARHRMEEGDGVPNRDQKLRREGEKQSVLDRDAELSFWEDGMIRVAGRECNGVEDSKCHLKGGMSCVDCHALHRDRGDAGSVSEWANDQLKARAVSDTACARCHELERYAGRRHTHHDPSSSGSRCYNCHMPHTSYGLLKATRSHLISSPSAAETARFRRQNACNVCHLDRSLGWTADRVAEWYGVDRPVLSADQERYSSVALAALKGDAVDRVLAAWHLGWEPAVAATGGEWAAGILAILMEDDYQAIRYVAGRSLKHWTGYADVPFDFVGTEASRQAELAQVREITLERSAATTKGGGLESSEIKRLLGLRDNRRVYLPE